MNTLFRKICSVVTVIQMLMCVNVRAEERPAIKYGTPIDSGGPTLTEAFTERSLTTIEDGKPIALVSVSVVGGSIVQIVDLDAEELLHTFNISAGGYCYWGEVDDDGVIYFTCGRTLVKYDPKEKKPDIIGPTPTYRSGNVGGITLDREEHMLYGGVPNTGNIFKCNPRTKEITALVSLYPECMGTSKPAVLGDYLYGGGGYSGSDGEGTHLYKIDKHSGEIEALPDPFVDDKIKAVGQVYAGGKYIFAQIAGYNTEQLSYIWDTASEKWVDKTFKWHTSGMTDIHEGKYYFLYDQCIHSIDVETLEITDYPDLRYGSHLRGNGPWVQLKDPKMPGYSFVTAQYNGNIYAFNTTTNTLKKIDVTLVGGAIDRRISEVECDDRLYVMGFKGTKGAAWDPDTGEIEYYSAGQGEGLCSDYERNMIYTGNYPGARIYVMDPSKPYDTKGGGREDGNNPWLWGDFGGDEDRPFAMEVVDDKVIVGTLPHAGCVGGALSVIDINTYNADVYSNIIPGESICSVTHKGNIVYASTTVTGGSGSIPTSQVCHIFAFDLDKREIIISKEVKIKGVSGNLAAVHGLLYNEKNDKLYCAAAGVDFIMDPDTLEIEKTNIYGSSFEVNAVANSQVWHEYKMQFDDRTGYLFRTGDIIDPDTLEIVCNRPDNWQFAGLDSKGNALFTGQDTTCYLVPVIRGDDRSYLIQGVSFFKQGDSVLYRNGNRINYKTYDDKERIMVPTRLTVTLMGGQCSYNADANEAIIKNNNGDSIIYKMNDNIVRINDRPKKFGVSMYEEDGISYFPLENLCEFFNKKIVTYNGICFICSEGENIYNKDMIDYILSEVYGNE